MRIKVLMENTAKEGFVCAHGLSFYVETEKRKILVDAGPDSRFADNAGKMGVDLSDVDIAFLSHGHYDHSGGLRKFLELNDKAVIYAAKGYDRPHYDRNGSYIGIEPPLAGHPRIKVISEDLTVDDEISIFASADKPRIIDSGNNGMTEGTPYHFTKAILTPETFTHEHYLRVGDVLFSGCSHTGIVNIASWAAGLGIKHIVGGFHFMEIKAEDFGQLDSIAGQLCNSGIKFYTCHCTGLEQFKYLKEIMGDSVGYLAAGDELEL